MTEEKLISLFSITDIYEAENAYKSLLFKEDSNFSKSNIVFLLIFSYELKLFLYQWFFRILYNT